MNALQSRLAALRRRLRLVTLSRGLSLLLATVLGAGVLAGVLDWALYLPGLVRAILLVSTLGGTAFLIYRYLFTPLCSRTDDLSLALRVEEQYPSLNDALASTVQFLEQSDEQPAHNSDSLRREAVQRALRTAKGCDFNKVIDAHGLRLAGVAALGMVVVALALVLWRPALAMTALLRLADPYGEHEWPRATQIALDFPKRITSKYPFLIEAKLTGTVPATATLEVEGLASASGGKEVLQYQVNTDDKGNSGTFTAKLDVGRQEQSFRFRVRANDAVDPIREGAWHTVTVGQAPRLVSLDGLPSPQLELHYPAYTDLISPSKESPGSGQVKAIAGTVVVLRGATDRPVAIASVNYRPEAVGALDPRFLALGVLGVRTPLEVATLAVGGQAAWDRVVAKVEPNGRRFTIEFQPWLSGSYVLRLEDSEGLVEETDPYRLEIEQDPSPQIVMERPARDQSVLPNADVTLHLRATDEVFAVRSVYLEVRRKARDGSSLDLEPRRVLLHGPLAVAQIVPQTLALLAPGPLPLPMPWPSKEQYLQVHCRWSLAGLAQEGDTLLLRAFANDFNDVVAHPIPGRSNEIKLHVVSRANLLADIDAAQAKIQQELLKLREWQENAIKKVIEAEQQWRTTGTLRPQDRDALLEAAQKQKEIQARVGASKGEDLPPGALKDKGLLPELEHLEQVMRDNKMPPSSTQQRLRTMKQELARVARKHLGQIAPRLEDAQEKIGGNDKTQPPSEQEKGKLGEARDHQEEVKRALDDLLQYLERWATTQEIKGETRQVLQEQRDLKAELEKVKDTKRGNEQADATIRKVAEMQRRLAERTEKLIERMERLAQERADKDPAAKEMLDKAATTARKEMLPQEMRDSDEQLRKKNPMNGKWIPQTERTVAQQGHSADVLEKMLKAMEENHQDDVERLIKKQKEAEKKLDDLVEKLEKLRKDVESAKRLSDPDQKKSELKRLAKQQRDLEEQVKEKGRELARLQAQRAGRDLAQAAEQMGRAARQLEEGEDPEDAQKEALERLEQAQEELKEARQESEEELAREQLAKIADHLKGLKERQDAALEESARIHNSVLKAGWKTALLRSLRTHGEAQTGLARETDSLGEKLKGAPVFERILKKAGKSMDAAVRSMEERMNKADPRLGMFPLEKEELEDENKSDRLTQDLQREASKRLDRLLEALKPALEAAENPPEKGDEGGGGGGEGQKGGIRGGDGIPPMAQLKALREEQMEVNERTKAFAERHPDVHKLPPERQRELDAIQAEQAELFGLLQRLLAGANEGG